MARCEDYPCCGHTVTDPCDYSGPTAADMQADPARYHIGCDHEAGWCEYEDDEDEDYEDEDEAGERYESASDADSYVLASAGWGTDEDYGYYGD